jgi:hypothetical protein
MLSINRSNVLKDNSGLCFDVIHLEWRKRSSNIFSRYRLIQKRKHVQMNKSLHIDYPGRICTVVNDRFKQFFARLVGAVLRPYVTVL